MAILENDKRKKEQRSKINNLNTHLRKQEKEEHIESIVRNKKKEKLEQKSMKLKTGNPQRKSRKPKPGSLEDQYVDLYIQWNFLL